MTNGCDKVVSFGDGSRPPALPLPRLGQVTRPREPRPSNNKAPTGADVRFSPRSQNLALAHNDWREQ